MQNILDAYMEMTGQNKEILLDSALTRVETSADIMTNSTVFTMFTQYEGRRYASSIKISMYERNRIEPEFIIRTLQRNLIEGIQDGVAWRNIEC